MKRTSRTPSDLSESLHQRLNSYTLAASAAGVGILALAQPAEAKIVYTKTYEVIGVNTTYNLDLNNDGIADFTLGYYHLSKASGTFRSVYALVPTGNAVEGAPGAHRFLAAALKRGTRISNRQRVTETNALMAYECDGKIRSCIGTTYFKGNWIDATNRYLGLKFTIKGKTHYGWARLTIPWLNVGFSVTLTGYAYETIPNKSIIAGKTHGGASLGALAAGSTALSSRQHKIRSK